MAETNANEFLQKLTDIKTKFDTISKQMVENEDELKRLQGEYRATVELGLKLGYLVETKPETPVAEEANEPTDVPEENDTPEEM